MVVYAVEQHCYPALTHARKRMMPTLINTADINAITKDKLLTSLLDPTMSEKIVDLLLIANHELLIRESTRDIGKNLTAALHTVAGIAPGNTEVSYPFSRCSKIIYKHVLGASVKAYKAANNISPEADIRDLLTMDQLRAVQELESHAASVVESHANELTSAEVTARICKMGLRTTGSPTASRSVS